jgi:hypothetical protein
LGSIEPLDDIIGDLNSRITVHDWACLTGRVWNQSKIVFFGILLHHGREFVPDPVKYFIAHGGKFFFSILGGTSGAIGRNTEPSLQPLIGGVTPRNCCRTLQSDSTKAN